MKKHLRTKLYPFFFCALFLLVNSCATNTAPPIDQDPLYQELNSLDSVLNSQSSAQQIAATITPGVKPTDAFAASFPMPAQNNLQPPTNLGNSSTALQPSSEIQQSRIPYQNPYANSTITPAMPPVILPEFISPQYAAPKVESMQEKDFSDLDCDIDESQIKEILEEIKRSKRNIISSLPSCLKQNRSLMMRAAIIDPSEFEFASDILKEDESFVHRMIEINPEILKFATLSLRANPDFMEEATYLNRDSLKYADEKLLDNKIFMRNMIKIDSRNYMFASPRLKEINEFASSAFKDDGMMLQYAPLSIKDNKNLVTIAVKSNSEALQFASANLQKNKDLQKIAQNKSSIKSIDNLRKFLRENYINDSNKKNVGFVIDNRMKFFANEKFIDRNYVTKWQRSFETKNSEDFRLIAADSRNFPITWHQDFKKFPVLVKRIERFLSNHNVDQNTIDNLATTYFWKVKKNPQTVVFNLYLLRDSKDIELGPKFADLTSLTAIAQKKGEDWSLSVIEVIFDSETKIDLAYPDGHKKYILWDLYQVDKNDKNPKIIFKVEDRFKEYFEIYEEQNNGKYRLAQTIDSIRDAADQDAKPVETIKSDDDSF